MKILVLNPGGNSLKVEIVLCEPEARYAFEGTKLFSAIIDDIGRKPRLIRLEGRKPVHTEAIEALDYAAATESFFNWYEKSAGDGAPALGQIDRAAIRVVHGGGEFDFPALIDTHVEKKIAEFEKLAPLHNKSSLDVLGSLRKRLKASLPVFGVFDTAFHRTIPDYASRYAIPLRLAEKHRIRRYGFHGISHRYMLERYAHLAQKEPSECNVVTMHLESGCSVTAIHQGESVDNTMGMTPLEGLMMGTRSGDVDPSLIRLLMCEEGMKIDEVMELLNKKSGLRGVSEVSLDTRILMKHYDSDPQVKLAMDMFAYRVRKAVGSYLAVLGAADAIIFGGGIGENTEFVRHYVCEGLRFYGVEIDPEANGKLIDIEGLLSRGTSRVAAWVIPTEEGMQIAHECCQALS